MLDELLLDAQCPGHLDEEGFERDHQEVAELTGNRADNAKGQDVFQRAYKEGAAVAKARAKCSGTRSWWHAPIGSPLVPPQ